ncbi:MAG: hypothetical protein IPK07_26230 [Deltaproteobacteria bacterium]|nr:hypothetical protein [Deltaproteobacteria bacterium]
MLTKSQARTFFFVGTGLCAIAFLGLTADTFRRSPRRPTPTRSLRTWSRASTSWESSNCMGCHTLFGEGRLLRARAHQVYERRGEAFIRAQLADPEKMFPGSAR